MSSAQMDAAERSSIVRDSMAVAIATGAYGISFGAIATTSGLDVWQACACSLLMFTGASQFALIGVVGAGGAPLLGSLAGLLLGSRLAFYGLTLAPRLALHGVRRALGAHLVIDESTAMAITRTSVPAARLAFYTTGLGIFILWNLTTLIGALAGDALGDPRRYGLDAAVGGAFLALLWPRLNTGLHRLCAALGAGVALLLVPLTPSGVPVIAAAVVALGLGLRARDLEEPGVPE